MTKLLSSYPQTLLLKRTMTIVYFCWWYVYVLNIYYIGLTKLSTLLMLRNGQLSQHPLRPKKYIAWDLVFV